VAGGRRLSFDFTFPASSDTITSPPWDGLGVILI